MTAPYAVTLVGRPDAARPVLETIEHAGLQTETLARGREIHQAGVDTAEPDALRAAIRAALEGSDVDWCVAPAKGRRKSIVICDMDSTMIGCECIDELADAAGVGPQVAEVTEKAMRGDLDFEAALTERVATLKGLPETVIAEVYAERVRLNAGAKALLATMIRAGAQTALVSGGFTQFTSRVAADAGFAEHRANQLEIVDGQLTGRVIPPILGREAKRDALERLAASKGVTPAAAIAIGDGANDLGMMEIAGLSVGYKPKPAVAERAHGVINSGDLRSALYFQGFDPHDVVEPD